MKTLGLEAVIRVDGVDLTEYDVKTDAEAKSVTCWIASEAGKPLAPLLYAVGGYVSVDGISIGGTLRRTMHGNGFISQKDRVVSQTKARPLLFAPINLTDDDAYLNSQRNKGLGDITLRIDHVQETGKLGQWSEVNDVSAEDKVHERSKKAMAHRVKFGEEMARPNTLPASVRTCGTLAIFVFKYRSLDVLRADGIAPPAPAAPRAEKRKARELVGQGDESENGEPTDDSVDEDEAELKAQLRLIQEKLAKKSKKVKTEPTARSTLVHGEIIDLT
ncbi:hypothetical protein DXG03_001901 [Asterophora parasitica]|uniref:DUF7918 domain-containing protein n=1 Tax=Asterophora parasitica TaxID=117018 RepID=A0A9P7G2W3_9AGAR|nr:hypothetical protein DXG03_001901 [Asterophora parasitica]